MCSSDLGVAAGEVEEVGDLDRWVEDQAIDGEDAPDERDDPVDVVRGGRHDVRNRAVERHVASVA